MPQYLPQHVLQQIARLSADADFFHARLLWWWVWRKDALAKSFIATAKQDDWPRGDVVVIEQPLQRKGISSYGKDQPLYPCPSSEDGDERAIW